MRRFVRVLAAASLVLGSTGSTHAKAQSACSAAAFRQFDFWAGSWKVYNHSDNAFAGTNEVTREFGGCVLQEHWKGSDGSRGSSFNMYDATRKIWHQTWVDGLGQLLVLEGGIKNGAMVLRGSGRAKKGRPIINQIIWTPAADGSVRQLWTVRLRDEPGWRTVFDGVYRRT